MLHASRSGPDPQADLQTSAAGNVSLARNDGKKHLLLAVSGSVATIKIANIIDGLASHDDLSIRLVLTASAEHFLGGQAEEQPALAEVRRLPNVDGIYTDAAEWTRPWVRGAPILHIELRRWAHLLMIVPLSANTMAKMVAGICDNLLLSVVRAWDHDGSVDDGDGAEDKGREKEKKRKRKKKKIVVAPAMNTAMWRNPLTARHVATLEEDWGGPDGWVEVLRPVSKELACNDVGQGAMVEWQEIVGVAEERLGLEKHGKV